MAQTVTRMGFSRTAYRRSQAAQTVKSLVQALYWRRNGHLGERIRKVEEAARLEAEERERKRLEEEAEVERKLLEKNRAAEKAERDRKRAEEAARFEAEELERKRLEEEAELERKRLE